jgi:polyisoprenoid-binding protein YceI
MRLRRTVLLPIAALAVTTVSDASPQIYQLEKTHADLVFTIDHAGFSQKHGHFRDLDATLTYDSGDPQSSSVTVTVKADSVDTGFAARDKDVTSPMFLDVEKYPEIRFASTRVSVMPDSTLRVEGNLTLHSITKPIVLHAKLNKQGPNPFDKRPTVGFSATGSLARSEYGIANLIPLIGDAVDITIDAEFNHSIEVSPPRAENITPR